MLYRFLIIDNNRIERNLYQAILFHHFKHSTIEFADSYPDALRKCSSSNYSVIISDMEMPRMSGTDFFEELKTRAPLSAKKIIFVSSNIETYKSSFFKENDCPSIQKPYKKRELLQLIDAIVGGEKKSSARDRKGTPGSVPILKAEEAAP